MDWREEETSGEDKMWIWDENKDDSLVDAVGARMGRSREQAIGYRQEQGEDRDERMVHVRRNVGAESWVVEGQKLGGDREQEVSWVSWDETKLQD